MIAIDTNILLWAHRAEFAEHLVARALIEKAVASPGGWGFSVFSVAECWSVATRAGFPPVSRPAALEVFLGSLRAFGARIWLPAAGFAERLIEWAVRLSITGRRIYDLQIALTALDNGAREIWTADRAFVALPGLRVLWPATDINP